MRKRRILVVDDEPSVRTTVPAFMEKEGYEVNTAADGASALRAARAFQPDVIVLDIMLPEMDGLEVLRRLRQESDVYVIMLTAKAEETDKLIGLAVGADDYLTKPFSLRELEARVRTVLRRDRSAGGGGDRPLTFRRLRVDPGGRRVWKDDEPIDLTPIEFDLLLTLARHQGRVMSREQLIEQVWGYDYYGAERVVDVHLSRIRKTIEDDVEEPSLIVTVRGAGYRFQDEPT